MVNLTILLGYLEQEKYLPESKILLEVFFPVLPGMKYLVQNVFFSYSSLLKICSSTLFFQPFFKILNRFFVILALFLQCCKIHWYHLPISKRNDGVSVMDLLKQGSHISWSCSNLIIILWGVLTSPVFVLLSFKNNLSYSCISFLFFYHSRTDSEDNFRIFSHEYILTTQLIIYLEISHSVPYGPTISFRDIT